MKAVIFLFFSTMGEVDKAGDLSLLFRMREVDKAGDLSLLFGVGNSHTRTYR